MEDRRIKKSLAWLSALLAMVLAFQLACLKKRAPVYNVILITIDTLRADHLSCYGYPRETSPFLDYLAQNGVLFEHAFSSISYTTPSHASIFTSLYPVQHKVLVNGARLHKEAFTMAEMFQDIGYQTAGFCSVGFLSNLSQGFDIFDNEKYKKLVHYRQAHQTIESVLDWLDSKRPNDKFFLWVHLFDPHRPYHPPQAYLKQMALKSEAEKELFVKYVIQICKLPPYVYKHKAKLIEDYNNYDAEILFTDQQIKRLVRAIEAKKFKSPLLWIITADHGEGLGNHGYKKHGRFIYNEQVHVPLIFYFSQKEYRGLRLKNLVRHVDILPTLADLLGYNLSEKAKFIQGISLWPLLNDNENNFPVQYAFYQRRPWNEARRSWDRGEIYGLQNLQFKYIYHSLGDDEFYDLRYDPFETKNIIDFPSLPRDKMKKIVELYYKTLSHQTITDSPAPIDKRHMEELKALGYIR